MIKVRFKLLSLVSTTPEELFLTKVDSEEYGSALLLAQKYFLDTDVVYQKRWRKENVSTNTIQDFLEKIKDRWWVLRECKQRIPSSAEGAQALLEYGLKNTLPSWKLEFEEDNEEGGELKDSVERRSSDPNLNRE